MDTENWDNLTDDPPPKRGRPRNDSVKRDPYGIDPDALTTDPEVRLRQLNLELYSARRAAENAGAVYVRAVKRMRAAEINMSRAVNEKRREQVISG